MYRRILIPNRTDCALRLVRACRALGIRTYLAVARDDRLQTAAEIADEVVYLGYGREAYVSQNAILETARHCLCEAILPGWGFLSEDFAFARKCRALGIHFVGPGTRHLQIFGDKVHTIQLLESAFESPHPYVLCDDPDFSRKLTDLAGPYMVKHRFGGGGKGIRLFEHSDDVLHQVGDYQKTGVIGQYYVEQACAGSGVRHIEFQYFGDGNGQLSLVGMRDCTPQIHYQKWLETSLRPDPDSAVHRLGIAIGQRLCDISYSGWGTVECLRTADGRFRLLELNPRLQVEHGVTEMSAGVDLVRAALELSCGCFSGIPSCQYLADAAEFRLFAQTTGRIDAIGFDGYTWPDHPCADDANYRIEHSVMPGSEISGVYDGLCARFMVRGSDCIDRMRQWLKTFSVCGVHTNLPLLMG